MLHRSIAMPVLALSACSLVRPCSAQFVEDGVEIIQTWAGEHAGDRFGFVNRSLGDMDGDGVTEIGIGAPDNTEAGTGTGKVYIYSGATGELLRSHVGNENDFLGYEMSGVGDIDGDGLAEYIIAGPGSSRFVTLIGPGRVSLYNGATGEIMHTWIGEHDESGFGAVCAGAGPVPASNEGDIDGDGTPDILIGSAMADAGGPQSGRMYVYSGATYEELFRFDGKESEDWLGFGLGGLGDLDGDGHSDFAVGAPNDGPADQGLVYVFSGRTFEQLPFSPIEADATGLGLGSLFVSGAGDIDGDGIPDIFASDLRNTAHGSLTGRSYVFSGSTGVTIREWTGEQAGEGFGVGRACGDVDHDGVTDFAISAWRSFLGTRFGGKCYIFSGATGQTLRTVTGDIFGDLLGWSTVGVGDVNGDTRIDFMVSAAENDDGGNNAGRVYVISGDTYACMPDWNRDGLLRIDDFLAFLSDFASVYNGGDYQYGDPDLAEPFGEVNTVDFIAFLNAYAAGC